MLAELGLQVPADGEAGAVSSTDSGLRQHLLPALAPEGLPLPALALTPQEVADMIEALDGPIYKTLAPAKLRIHLLFRLNEYVLNRTAPHMRIMYQPVM